jgi:hypothetical protein
VFRFEVNNQTITTHKMFKVENPKDSSLVARVK